MIKGVIKTIKNKVKGQKGRFVAMLFGTLGTILLWNLLTSKGTIRTGKGTIKAGHGF